MHGTLRGGKRINYGNYGASESAEIESVASEFLTGERDNIGEIDSLHRVREVFSFIRTQYRQSSQKVDAMRRQIEANPEAFASAKSKSNSQKRQGRS